MSHEQAVVEHSLRINKNVVSQNSKPETTVFRKDYQRWYIAQKAQIWKYWIEYWYTISIQGCSSKMKIGIRWTTESEKKIKKESNT